MTTTNSQEEENPPPSLAARYLYNILATHDLRPSVEDTDILAFAIPGEHERYSLIIGKPETRNITHWPYRTGQPLSGPVFPPLPTDDDNYYMPCAVCTQRLGLPGWRIQLVFLGAETDQDKHAHCAGQEYPAVVIIVHARCHQGREPDIP